MSLGQQVIQWCIMYFLNHWTFFVILAIILVFGFKWYFDYFRINSDTDNVDIMGRYLYVQMRKRYAKSRI